MADAAIATPRARQTLLSRLLTGPAAPAIAARAGARVAAFLGRPIRIGSTVLAVRHADVAEMLSRDLDFLIAPVNAARIEAVNGPFVLGMDRSATLAHERGLLYRALSGVDLWPIARRIEADAAARVGTVTSIDVVNGYARPIAAGTARQLFGVSEPDDATLMDVARAIFNHTFLNLTDDAAIRARALAAAPLLHGWLEHAGGDLAARLRELKADPDLVRRTLGGLLVGSIDTTASTVAKIVWVIGQDARLAARMTADAGDPERLRGWCWDALRRWPHNPILLRQVAADTVFAKTKVKAGDRVFAWTQAAMMDATVFPDPSSTRPDRPVSVYLHFGGGLHPCAGRWLNAIQVPALVGALLRRGIAGIGPIAWAGPFPDRFDIRLSPSTRSTNS